MDLDSFKMFLLDIGLLIAMTDLDARVIIDGNRIFTEFKGALTEQYVLQQLISEAGIVPYYYLRRIPEEKLISLCRVEHLLFQLK